jgi:hypothetical protein
MADQKELTKWILTHRNTLDLKVNECTWIRSTLPGWFDLEVSILVQGRRYVGRGSSDDADTALCKSFCEAIERSVCDINGISSTGVAGHFCRRHAQQNAKLEFIERAAFSACVQGGFIGIPADGFEDLRERYAFSGIRLRLFRLTPLRAVPVFLCLGDGLRASRTFGGVLGLGSSEDERTAALKALIECLRGLEAQLEKPLQPLSLEEFSRIDCPSGLERQRLLRHADYFLSHVDSLKVGLPDTHYEFKGKFEELFSNELVGDPIPLAFFRFLGDQNPAIEPAFVG